MTERNDKKNVMNMVSLINMLKLIASWLLIFFLRGVRIYKQMQELESSSSFRAVAAV